MAELVVPFAKREGAEGLSKGAPAWVLEARLAALQRFDTTPVESSPLFNKHVITEGAPVSAVVLGPPASPTPAVETMAPGPFSAHVRIVDGAVLSLALGQGPREAGLVLSSISAALVHNRPLAEALLTSGATDQADKFFQLTRALFQDGVILDVPEGLKLDAPIRLEVVQKAPKVASFARVIVRLGKGASAEVLESQSSAIDAPSVQGVGCEAHVGDEAALHYSAVGNFGPQVGVFLNRQAAVGRHGRAHWSLGNFGGALTKSLTHTRLTGDDSQVKHTEVVFGAQTQKFDISSFVTHIGRRARSDVLARAALRHKSRGNVKGMITIDHSGTDADSYLGQFALLLDREAKSVAIPGLEIETAQVIRAKHAAAVQQIDENQVFYLQSRGIPPETGRRLIVEGFLNPVIEGISSVEFRAEVHRLIEAKWG